MNLNQFNLRNLGVTLFNAYSFKVPAYLKILFVGVFVCFLGSAKAQRRSTAALTYGGGGGGNSGYGIMFGVGYDAPLGVLKDAYKPTIAYNLGLTRAVNNFTLSFSFGYHEYKQKDLYLKNINNAILADSSSNPINFAGVPLGNYKIYSAYLGAVYNIDLTDGIKLYGGANIGVYQAHYYVIDPNYVIDENSNQASFDSYLLKQRDLDFYIAPRLGVTFALNENIDFSLESKYNFFAPTGNSQGSGGGTFYTSGTGQAAITFKF